MIYYFSGTGNSEYAAKKLAASEGDVALYAPDVISGRAITPLEARTDILGFVFPVYYAGLPSIVEPLLEAIGLTGVHGRYIYLVLTCGATTYNAAEQFKKLLSEHGCRLSASYAVRMVDNYIPMFRVGDDEAISRRLEEADRNLEGICESVHNRETGDFNKLKGFLPGLMTAMSYPLYQKGRKTASFCVSDSCTGCGVCARGCPVSAIQIQNGRPVWVSERCTLCLRCLHSCPACAIDYGKGTRKKRRYVNPKNAK